jgi:hypothetical protein
MPCSHYPGAQDSGRLYGGGHMSCTGCLKNRPRSLGRDYDTSVKDLAKVARTVGSYPLSAALAHTIVRSHPLAVYLLL